MHSDYFTFCLTQLIHIVIYLLNVYGAEIFQANFCVIAVCLIPSGHYTYSITGHLTCKSEVQAQSDKEFT